MKQYATILQSLSQIVAYGKSIPKRGVELTVQGNRVTIDELSPKRAHILSKVERRGMADSKEKLLVETYYQILCFNIKLFYSIIIS